MNETLSDAVEEETAGESADESPVVDPGEDVLFDDGAGGDGGAFDEGTVIEDFLIDEWSYDEGVPGDGGLMDDGGIAGEEIFVWDGETGSDGAIFIDLIDWDWIVSIDGDEGGGAIDDGIAAGDGTDGAGDPPADPVETGDVYDGAIDVLGYPVGCVCYPLDPIG